MPPDEKDMIPVTPTALPVSTEAEAMLISCCFIDGVETVAKCFEAGISVNDFSLSSHQIVYAKIVDLFMRRLPATIDIVGEELRASKQIEMIGGYLGLMDMSRASATTSQLDYYIKRVRELSRLRGIITATKTIAERAAEADQDIEEFSEHAEKDFFNAVHRTSGTSMKLAREHTGEAVKTVDQIAKNRGMLTGIGSGFIDLDSLTGGFQRQELIVLAARPSMGKTALALNFAEAATMPRKGNSAPTLVFSLEMSSKQLIFRMLCARARISVRQLRAGLVSTDVEAMKALRDVRAELDKAPLLLDESSTLTITQLRAKARLAHVRHGLGMIVVDYLQLLSPTDPRAPREQQVAEASRGLKALAKELDVPVIVLSQLNRASEKENRTPKLADLRESGAIEQDADVVMMLAHPRDAEEKFQVAGAVAELIVAKQRNGPVGDLRLTFLREFVRFENFILP